MSELKITDVKTYFVPRLAPEETPYKWSSTKPFLFVKLTTDKGICGWGECYTLADRERAIDTHIDEMKRYLIGFDPLRIKYFQYWACHLFGERRQGIDLSCAASGVEIAMWDIAGKYFNTPVYNLLGGKFHSRLRAYLNLGANGYKTPGEEVEITKELSKKYGYTAVKLYPFYSDRYVDQAVERIAKIREGLGSDYELMIDVWRDADPVRITDFARKIEKYNISWFEEPIAPDFPDRLVDMRNRTSLPLVAGEAMFGKRSFSDLMKRGATDYLNPDVSVVGGILELKDIATIAEANYVKVGPHNCNSSTVSAAASAHAACTMPNFYSMETFPWYWEIGEKISGNQLTVKDGYMSIPEGPGLGIDMNEDYLSSLKYEPKPMNSWENRE